MLRGLRRQTVYSRRHFPKPVLFVLRGHDDLDTGRALEPSYFSRFSCVGVLHTPAVTDSCGPRRVGSDQYSLKWSGYGEKEHHGTLLTTRHSYMTYSKKRLQ